MKHHPAFARLWVVLNLLLCLSVGLLIYGCAWEHSTREYLRGFADAVVPAAASPEEKAESILEWMQSGPTRLAAGSEDTSRRDPQDTLNYRALLQVCGTATNAFVNLAASSGLEVRRLLLLDENRGARHVVAELFVDGRWIVVDPSFRTIFRDSRGRTLTKEELKAPAVFAEATGKIFGYPPEYTFERTGHLRLRRVPVLGPAVRSFLDFVSPGWDSAPWLTLVVERRSMILTVLAGAAVLVFLFLRMGLALYGEKRLHVSRVRLRDRFVRVFAAVRGDSE